MQPEIAKAARFEDRHGERADYGCSNKRRYGLGNHGASEELGYRRHEVEQDVVSEREQPRAQQRPEWVGLIQSRTPRTCTPCRATLVSSTSAPAAAITPDTFAFAPGATRNTTHPPPPAPQAFAAMLPARRAVETR